MTGNDIYKIRQAMDLSIADFAASLGVAASTVYRWEQAHGNEVQVDQMRLGWLLRAQQQVGINGVEASKVGNDIVNAIAVAGALYASYKFLEWLFKDKR